MLKAFAPLSLQTGWLLFGGLLALLASAGGGAVAGYHYRGISADLALQGMQTESTRQFAQAQAQAAASYRNEAQRAHVAELSLIGERDRFDADRRTLQSRISSVTTRYIPAPGAGARPLPECVFTRGWLRDYNAALGLSEGGTPATASDTGQDSSEAASADAWLLPADGVTQADILAHVADYGAWCRGTAAQVEQLAPLAQGAP